jgi:DNA-binding NarL/FixJ family response regulator
MNTHLIKLWIIEDQQAISEGLKRFIENNDNRYNIETFDDGESVIQYSKSQSADIILLDLGLPGIDGIDVLIYLKEKLPSSKILVFSIYQDNQHLFDALKFGACGYILKQETPLQIYNAIVEALNDGAPMSREIAMKVIQSFSQKKLDEDIAQLTSREIEVLKQLSQGLLYKEIATNLDLSQHTVKNHVQNVYFKLHVSNRSEAIIKYLQFQA